MRIISFMWFKENCNHLDEDYDFDKSVCGHGWHEHTELLTIDPESGKKYYYHPCKEKYCPVLQNCKEIKWKEIK